MARERNGGASMTTHSAVPISIAQIHGSLSVPRSNFHQLINKAYECNLHILEHKSDCLMCLQIFPHALIDSGRLSLITEKLTSSISPCASVASKGIEPHPRPRRAQLHGANIFEIQFYGLFRVDDTTGFEDLPGGFGKLQLTYFLGRGEVVALVI